MRLPPTLGLGGAGAKGAGVVPPGIGIGPRKLGTTVFSVYHWGFKRASISSASVRSNIDGSSTGAEPPL